MGTTARNGDKSPSTDTWKGGIFLGLRLATAHHPLCSWFQDDVYRVGPVKLCRGCVAAWPMMILGLVAAVFILSRGIPWYVMAGTGLLLGIPHGTTYLRRFNTRYRTLAKLTSGFGLGLLIPALLVMPYPLWIRYVLLGSLGMAFLLLQAVRMRKILTVCDACPWQRDWARCPGFSPYAEKTTEPE